MQPSKTTGFLSLLSISPMEDDHVSLQSIVRHSAWILHKADSLSAALTVLGKHDISVVLCASDLMPGRWTDALRGINSLPQPPSLIVTSRLADERLWAEALNLGAWDVLAQPFDHREVVRSVKSAWQHWHNQSQTESKLVRAAS